MDERSDDFTTVVPGDSVTVSAPGRLYLTGVVEDKAPDGSVLWVREDGGQGRHMVHVTDTAHIALREPATS